MATTRVSKVEPSCGGGYLYPHRSELLDRRVLIQDLRRTERKVLTLSKKYATCKAEAKVAIERQVRERRATQRFIDHSLLPTFEILARALGEEETWLGTMLRSEEGSKLVEETNSEEDAALRKMTARFDAVAFAGECLADKIEGARIYTTKDEDVRVEEEEREDPGEVRVRQLSAEVDILKVKLENQERRNAELHDLLAASRDDHKIFADAKLAQRDFRDAVMKLLSQLAAAVHRRLGFVPRETRNDIDTFMTFLLTQEEGDLLVN